MKISRAASGRALLLAGMFIAGPAHAALCALTGGSILPNAGTCAEVSAKVFTRFGGSGGNPIPPSYGFSPGPGSSNAVIADTGGDASAIASADFGLLRLTATSNVGTPDPATFALARAVAAFADVGTIALPGALPGDPVQAFVTLDIEGSHNNDVSGILDAHLNIGRFYNLTRPANGVYRFSTRVGDVVSVALGLSIFADASSTNPFSIAAYGNSARLHIDFDDASAYFDAASGHDYRTASVVPLPASLSLFMLGAGALVTAVRRRRTVT